MKLQDLVSQGGQLQIIASISDLNDFAQNVAQSTAQRIIDEIHQPDRPISEAEACEIYHRTRQTFSKYRRRGKIRFHLVGGGIVYFQRELEEDFKKL